ncbi:hypothetical protein N431DRAFT_434602 [Stipitochalara longipes BDJ]|nr:hypothetical protein N431DRAFT_434602 [Stipitochalara longipes BDJ]
MLEQHLCGLDLPVPYSSVQWCLSVLISRVRVGPFLEQHLGGLDFPLPYSLV